MFFLGLFLGVFGTVAVMALCFVADKDVDMDITIRKDKGEEE